MFDQVCLHTDERGNTSDHSGRTLTLGWNTADPRLRTPDLWWSDTPDTTTGMHASHIFMYNIPSIFYYKILNYNNSICKAYFCVRRSANSNNKLRKVTDLYTAFGVPGTSTCSRSDTVYIVSRHAGLAWSASTVCT